MLRNEGDRLTSVIVSTPKKEYFNIFDTAAHNINENADIYRTILQHNLLKSVLSRSGCKIIDIPELGGHPNSVFTRDTALMTPKGYIRLRMGLDSRRGEEEWMSGVLASLGERCIGEIKPPGIAEGGDIILAGNVAFIGHSKRTNKEGIEQLSGFLKEIDYEIRVFEVEGKYLHLGGAMSMIGPERILCCSDVFPDGFFKGFDTIEVSYPGISSGNVICIRENEVIANIDENYKVVMDLETHGVNVHGLDLSEFRKGAGGPTCLILPVERTPDD